MEGTTEALGEPFQFWKALPARREGHFNFESRLPGVGMVIQVLEVTIRTLGWSLKF
jgi:hypothetical protein